MTNDLEEILQLAKQQGATHAEVYQVRSRSQPVFFEANRLKQLESSESEGCALRLWHQGKPGLAVAYGTIEPAILVNKAMALAQLNPPETVELVSVGSSIYPPVGKTIAVEQLVEQGKKAITIIQENYPEVICSAELACSQETTTLINSLGLHCEYTDISLSGFMGIEWIRGEDFLGIYQGEHSRNTLNTNQIVEKLIQRLDWAKANVTPPTGNIPILFTADAATMLWDTIEAALNAKRVKEKSSPWSELQGETVIAPNLTLTQKPKQGPYSCPFDDEGNPTQPLSLIEKGKLQQFYTDTATARALGTTSTGNGFRPSLGRYPTPELVNLVIEPGDKTWAQLKGYLDKGLLVDQILGGGADISGDFSINVDLGYRIEKGKIVGRVKDTMVAGNVYTALKQLVALGSDCSWNGSFYTPSLIVDGLSVVG